MKDRDPQLKEVPTAKELARERGKRILRWATKGDCERCDGNGFYRVDLKARAVIMVADNFPKYETPVKIRVVCECVEVK